MSFPSCQREGGSSGRPCHPCPDAEGRAAKNFLVGLILLVTDSIFHARKYVFLNGRKNTERKAFLHYPSTLNTEYF
jgi:hypothetical protein